MKEIRTNIAQVSIDGGFRCPYNIGKNQEDINEIPNRCTEACEYFMKLTDEGNDFIITCNYEDIKGEIKK